MKTLEKHWGKILLALLVLGVVYFKYIKPKQEQKKAAKSKGATVGGGVGGVNVDPETGGDLVSLEPEQGTNTDPGIDLGSGFAEPNIIGGGDTTTNPVATARAILGMGDTNYTGGSSLRNTPGKPCAVGAHWDENGVCVYDTKTASSMAISLG